MATKAKKWPATQRAFGLTLASGLIYAVRGTPTSGSDTPVLVVPEAAVKGCRHLSTGIIPASPLMVDWCKDCGSIRFGSRFGSGKWQRPRLLRVARRR